MASIRVGIGGWVYAPWRGVFYPPKLPQAKELEHASRQVTTIEINGTFYGAQKPESFRRWARETPDDFVFSVKGTRYATHRNDLEASEPTLTRFFGTGVLELGDKLGPIFWQFPEHAKFEAGNWTAFLELLPKEIDGRRIRHVVEVRHASFFVPEFMSLLRRYGVARAFVDSEGHQPAHDLTADFVYARLRRSEPEQETGYPAPALDAWAERFQAWAAGREPADAAHVDPTPAAPSNGRDCFVYFIAGAKERNPAAAQALLKRLAK